MSTQAAVAENTVVTRAIAKINDIATLPEVTVKIIKIVEDPESTARDLHAVIKTDPALSTKVLKVVNSAFYGLPGQIASVDRAIVLLGMSAVKNIAVAASIAKLFKTDQMSEQFTAKDLWEHSVAVGTAARLIARASGQPAGLEEMFLAGLIHDVGILVERQALPDELTQVINKTARGEGTFLENEIAVMGADHQQFGDALTTKWKFPRHLRAVVGYHHQPEQLAGELQRLGYTVYVADVLCCQKKIGFYQTSESAQITEETLEAAGISVEQYHEICDQLDAALDETGGFLA